MALVGLVISAADGSWTDPSCGGKGRSARSLGGGCKSRPLCETSTKNTLNFPFQSPPRWNHRHPSASPLPPSLLSFLSFPFLSCPSLPSYLGEEMTERRIRCVWELGLATDLLHLSETLKAPSCPLKTQAAAAAPAHTRVSRASFRRVLQIKQKRPTALP